MAVVLQKEIVKEIGYTDVFERTRNSKAFVIINVGGARSSKSYSIAQLLISKLVTEKNKKIGICRKTFPALRTSTLEPFIALLKEYGIYDEDRHNKTYSTYDYGTNRIYFFGVDESEKIKSTEYNYIWMEEANEFTYEDYIALKLRLSGPVSEGEMNHMYLSLNPVDAHNWIPVKAAQESDVEVIHSTYEDNPYLSAAYKKSLLDLINQDENAYRIYVLGEWGKLEGKIYTNYSVIPELPLMEGAKWAYGLDFGLINPTAIVKVYLYNDKFYVEERLYQTNLTNADIIEFFSHEKLGDIHADPSAKQSIAEIRRAGYMAFESIKDVKAGIDLCKRQTIYIPQESSNLITEIQNYHWKKDRTAIGDRVFLPEPVKYKDHALDAMRYAIWGLASRFGFATQRPSNIGPIKSLTFAGSASNDAVLDRWMRR